MMVSLDYVVEQPRALDVLLSLSWPQRLVGLLVVPEVAV